MPSTPASRSGSPLHLLATALLLVVLPATPGRALDRTILGKRLVVTNPKPTEPRRRKVLVVATEAASSETVVGDPTAAGGAGGAILHVVANGTNGVVQRYELPQGTGPGGRALWRAAHGGFRYADPQGAHGPVRSVVVGRRANGTFVLRAVLTGRHAPLEVVPPAPGADGFLTLKLGAGDRYCARFGPEGKVKNRADRLWKVERPTVEGCPPFGEVLALSYNVAGLPEGLSGSHPATNTPIISPLLNRYDLVVVQESWQTPDPNPFPTRVFHELLVADATHAFKSISAPLPLGTDPRRPTALVSDGLNWMSRYPFAEVVRVAWDGCHQSAADCLAFKGFAVARATLAAGVTVDVYDLHMEAGGDPEDDQLRLDGVNQLAAFMATFSAGRPVIVGGDFNLHTDEEPDATTFATLLALSGLQDVCAALGCPEPGRIDKFLFRSNDAVTITPRSWRFETDLFVDPAGEPLSDHDALAVRFEWARGDD